MNCTLYIDESGDFESQKGEWVLSGILFFESYNNCEKALNIQLKNLPSKLSVKSIKDFHLTEFRKKFGHNVAISMAKETINELNLLPFDYHCLVSINNTKTTLSNKEKTYRLMLSDLLALCETVIPETHVINNLDLVVATRTIDGKLQTNISNIDREIINSLPVALEVDLATKGMVDLIGKHINIKMDYANNSWGLVYADFLANINYHHRKNLEKNILNHLAKLGKYSLFESFGGFEIRRANVAERDGDYVLALYRWIVISSKISLTTNAIHSVQRLIFKLFNRQGTSGHIESFNALLERLWRFKDDNDKYRVLSKMLGFFEKELLIFVKLDSNNKDYKNIIFRLRNMMLIVENHIGNTEKSLIIAKQQNAIIDTLASNPEYFQMILDFKIYEIELLINSLKIEQALLMSQEYYNLVQNYKDVWRLLINKDVLDIFDNSRTNIKSEMTLLRCKILSNKILEIDSGEMIEKFEEIELILSNKIDISRLNNYRIMHLLKQKKSSNALNFFLSVHKSIHTKKLNDFDLLWFIKVVNETLLDKSNKNDKDLNDAIRFQIANISTITKGHPIDIIWREVALYEFQIGNQSLALKSIKKSKNTFNLVNSPISIWLQTMTTIHEDFIRSELKNKDEYLNKNFFVNIDSDSDFFRAIRLTSPY